VGQAGGVNRTELAAFLRSRRERLRPADVGLPAGGGSRRTPGLRRQEVAQLAGMSVDYYIRLEQGRGPKPSRQVLSALTRALMLTVDEREYLFRMAGENPPAATVPSGPSSELLPATRYLLDSLHDTPAYVVNARYDVLAWNRMATHFIGDLSVHAVEDRNLIRWTFANGADSPVWRDEGAHRFTRATVADLRAAYARYPGDPGIAALVTELLGTSPVFAQMWAAQDVEVRRGMVKRIDHPYGGPMEFECQVLTIADSDQRMIVYCAEPGSPTEQTFRRLAATPQAAPSR
jgi:transcriptional regulator with XRE-family HTH domain